MILILTSGDWAGPALEALADLGLMFIPATSLCAEPAAAHAFLRVPHHLPKQQVLSTPFYGWGN